MDKNLPFDYVEVGQGNVAGDYQFCCFAQCKILICVVYDDFVRPIKDHLALDECKVESLQIGKTIILFNFCFFIIIFSS